MSLRNEQLLMLDALAYYSSFSNGYRENEVWYMFKTVGEFVEAALANPDAYKTCFDGAMSYGDDELGMHDILGLVKDDPELMNLEIVYPIEVDEATCSVCLINRGTNEVYVIYGGNYGQGEYQYDGNTLNTWVENAMGATEADTDDQLLAVDFYVRSINAARTALGLTNQEDLHITVSGHSAAGNHAQYVTITYQEYMENNSTQIPYISYPQEEEPTTEESQEG